MPIDELISHYEDRGQKLIIKKNKKVFAAYAIIMMIIAIIFFKIISSQSEAFHWPFYLLVVLLLLFSAKYLKTAISGYKIVLDNINKTILLNDGNLISFKDISCILIRFKNTADTHYCFLELLLQNGSCYQITKSDITLRKNIEATASKISTFINSPVRFEGRSFSLL